MGLKQGVLASIASFLSLSSGASLGQYGPIVHLGGLVGSWARQNRFAPKWGPDIWLGCGVAAAISAAFHAPIAGIIFAHEAILRHFSARAAAPISISAISASAFSAWLFGGDRILAMSAVPEDILPHLPIFASGGNCVCDGGDSDHEDEFLVYRPPEQAQLSAARHNCGCYAGAAGNVFA